MDRDEICSQFLDTVEFDLYPYQEEALLAWFESDGGLLITVPTGMGKTLIAEAAVFEALHTSTPLYYTTPLIALTDQKFREFQQRAQDWGFPRDHIGLITGNRQVNPDAPVRVVVAEILLNQLLSEGGQLADVGAVVMDEFHYFNDFERGIVWELSLTLLPAHVRLMLLSATVGNPVELLGWIQKEHGRKLRLIQSQQRRVPLEYHWVADKLMTEQLPGMLSDQDQENRSPALVFCFNRAECWEIAERLKGLKLIGPEVRAEIDERLDVEMFSEGAGLKLRQMLIRGVGVHHAGILPKYKEVVESLFLDKLIPYVICTETLAAGINLPARSVVLSTLLKGKRGDKKIVPASAAHQMFGRAGRPQFDTEGHVYVLAPEDDVKIAKWRKKYEQIDPNTKDPGLLRAKKQLERKKPSRRKTQQYWAEGQFRTLIQAGPANLMSRSMIPYQVLIYLLLKTGRLDGVRTFLTKRFNSSDRLEKFQDQLDHMIANLQALGYLTISEDETDIELKDGIRDLLNFRSVNPLYGVFLARRLGAGSFDEKLQALESVLSMPPAIARQIQLGEIEPGPLQSSQIEPTLLKMGLVVVHPDGGIASPMEDTQDYIADGPEGPRRLSLPEMLSVLFEAKLKTPEQVFVQPKWVAGGVFELDGDFNKFVKARDLVKNEGLVLRHLLRLIILSGEMQSLSDGDPDYEQICDRATAACTSVDERYTDRFLSGDQEARKLTEV